MLQGPKSARRSFLKGMAIGGVSTVSVARSNAFAFERAAGAEAPVGVRPSASTPASPEVTDRSEGLTFSSSGGDYMVDVMRKLGIEYFAATVGNTFMGVVESVLNHGMLSVPALSYISTLHEEASVAMAHGYAKIAGKPMACGMHTAVGLQHASMAIYNAWCDRVPVFMVVGASIDAATRMPGVDWVHSVQDGPELVRDFTKWDDTPGSLRAWGDAAARAYKFAVTPPYGPVLLATDMRIQEEPYPGGVAPNLPNLPKLTNPTGDSGAIEETAKLLVGAENPVLYADRLARTPAGLEGLVELAELLQCAVVDTTARFNFPWRHPLNQSEWRGRIIPQADLLLELETSDPFSASAVRMPDGTPKSLMKAGSKRISLSSTDLYMKSNYQDFGRYPLDLDLAITGDAEATLPSLIEAVRRRLPDGNQAAMAERGSRLAQMHNEQFGRAKDAARFGWDASPISMPRLCMELYEAIKDDDWTLASASDFQSRWPQKLWTATKHHNYIGSSGGAGVGYLGPATVGAALANKDKGRITVAINGDGDTMMSPGIFWTAAHAQIPLLYIVHNNRGYHMELMQLQKVANRRERGADRVRLACEFEKPHIDFAQLARGMGVFAEGPIEKPGDLGPAIRRALAVVRKGGPAVIDVVSQGR